MEHKVLYLLVLHIFSLIERELAQIVGGLGIERIQSFNNLLILLFGGKLLLVDAAHVGLVHYEIVLILNVV